MANQNTVTSKSAAINALIKIVGDTIKETSPTPAGILYAGLMGYGINLQIFDTLIDAFIATKKVRKEGNLLFWID